MVLGVGIAGAVYATTLGLSGDPGAEGVLRAAGIGLLVGSGVALLGAVTAASCCRRFRAEAVRHPSVHGP